MLGRVLLSILFISFTVERAFAAEGDLRLIDAAELLAQKFSIPSTPIRHVDECLPLTSGSGMQARKVPCNYFHVLRNIAIEKIISVSMKPPQQDPLPTFREELAYPVLNCDSHPFPINDDLKYSTIDVTSYTTREVIKNAGTFSSSFTINASILRIIGARYGEANKDTIEYSLDRAQETKYTGTNELTRHIRFDVDPHTNFVVYYSDTKRSLTSTVTITAVLKAEVQEEIRALNGNVARATIIQRLDHDNSPSTEAQRTLTVTGDLFFKASDQQLAIRIFSQPATAADCTLPAR